MVKGIKQISKDKPSLAKNKKEIALMIVCIPFDDELTNKTCAAVVPTSVSIYSSYACEFYGSTTYIYSGCTFSVISHLIQFQGINNAKK